MPPPRDQPDILAVIPVGPAVAFDSLRDTVDSIEHYALRPTQIVLLDNSGADTARRLQRLNKAVLVHEMLDHQGRGGRLYINLARLFAILVERHACQALLKIDDDGLVIAPGGDVAAVAYFAEHPQTAIIGSYRQTCTGAIRDFGPPEGQLRRDMSLVGALRRPRLARSVRRLVRQARSGGYELGEHCLGGVCYYNPRALLAMHARGNLVRHELAPSLLGEDHIFALLACATGFKLADFATGALPIGAAWKGLPCSPAELLASGKMLTHSVRSYQDYREPEIRAYFQDRRTKEGGGRAPA